MYKKLITLLLVTFMVLPVFAKTTFIFAEDEDEEEETSGCYINGDYFDEDECVSIYENARQRVKELEAEIESAKENQTKQLELAQEYASKAESMQAEIDDLSTQIEELKTRIDVLIEKISENEIKVEDINTRVKNRMVESQKTMHFNGYLEFILGSKSFTDMLSRIYGVQAIVSKDENDRETLIEIITQLNKDKAELDESKKKLDESYQEIVAKQEEFKVMEEFYEEEAARIQIELDEMTEERDSKYESYKELAEALKEAGISTNDGFVAAVHNSWISSTVWNYSDDFLDGQWHLGVDYAASRYTEIHAPAAGVIIRADDGCNDHFGGSLSDSCGAWIAGGGNQVYMMCEVDGAIYGFIFFHMNSVNVSYGDFVMQDEVIGLVGSSGKSTGPHCHIEMYLLGYGELSDYLAMNWNATFSVGRAATAYSNRCEYNDGSYRQSPPCILNPELYLPE